MFLQVSFGANSVVRFCEILVALWTPCGHQECQHVAKMLPKVTVPRRSPEASFHGGAPGRLFRPLESFFCHLCDMS